ncbi:MAG: hypothetical protein ACKVOH_02575 [Chlamydiales bacterium]
MEFLRSLLSSDTRPRAAMPASHGRPSAWKAIGDVAIRQLCDGGGPEEEATTEQIAVRVLQEASPQGCKIWRDWRFFAVMHNSSILDDSTFAGVNDTVCLESWDHILALMESGEGILFESTLNPSSIKALRRKIAQTLSLARLIPDPTDTIQSYDALSVKAGRFRKQLFTELQRDKVVYVPMGYRGGVKSHGHSVLAKFTLEEGGMVAISILNLGAGCERNPIVGEATTHQKISYSSYPMLISAEDLFRQEKGMMALVAQFRLLSDPPPKEDPYKAGSLYSAWEQVCVIRPDLGENPTLYAAKTQRGPNCGQKTAKLLMRDFLQSLGLSREEVKIIFLSGRFCMLMAGFHEYHKAPIDAHRALLHDAAHECGLGVLKLKGRLAEEEQLIASFVAREILEQSTPLPPLPQEQDLPVKGRHATLLPPCDFTRKEIFPNTEILQRKEDQQVFLPHCSPPSLFRAETFVDELDEWTRQAERMSPEDRFHYLHEQTLSLPIPQFGEKDSWATIPPEQALAITKKLLSLTIFALKAPYERPQRWRILPTESEELLILYTSFAICDHLTRMQESSCLTGFATPLLSLMHLYPSTFLSLPLGEENRQMHAINTYFADCAEKNRHRFIFPVCSELKVDQWTAHAVCHHDRTAPYNHVDFLKQFASQTRKVDFVALWQGKGIHPGVMILYHFCYLEYQKLFIEPESNEPLTRLLFKEMSTRSSRSLLLLAENGSKIGTEFASSEKIQADVFAEQPYECTYAGVHMYSRKFATCSVNDAICLREELQENIEIPPHILRELWYISRAPELSVDAAIQWIPRNFIYLGSPTVQKMLFHCLFAPGRLSQKIDEVPEVKQEIREILQQGLALYRNNPHHISAILFLLRVGISLESFQPRLREALSPSSTSSDPGREALLFYRTTLQTLHAKRGLLAEEPQTQILLYGIQLMAYLPPVTEEEAILAALLLFQFSTEKPKVTFYLWNLRKCTYFCRRIAYSLVPFVTSRQSREKIAHAICKAKKVEPEGEWRCLFPTLCCRNYTVNLFSGEVEDALGSTFCEESLKLPKHLSLWGQEYEKGYMVDLRGGVMTHVSGRLRARRTARSDIWEAHIPFRGEDVWCEVFCFSHDELIRHDLSYLQNRLRLNPYRILEPKSGDPEYLLVSQNGQHIKFGLINRGVDRELVELDEAGHPTGLTVLNLDNIDSKHPYAHLRQKIRHSGEVLIYVDRKGELQKLEFLTTQCTFTRTDAGMVSSKFPGFVLKMGKTDQVTQLNGYVGAWLLEDEKGEKRVLLNRRRLEIAPGDFSREVLHKEATSDQEKFTLYTICDKRGLLLHEDDAALFFLVQILKMQRDYTKALDYLRLVKEGFFHCYQESIDSEANKAVNEVMTLTDYSPGSLAFNAHLFYRIVDHCNTMSDSYFADKEIKNFVKWIEWGIGSYFHVLSAMSQDSLSSIKRPLRLSKLEELIILRFLYKYYADRKIDFPHVLELRLRLLASPGGVVPASLQKQEVKLGPNFALLSPSALRGFERDKFGPSVLLVRRIPGLSHDIPAIPVYVSPQTLICRFTDLFDIALQMPQEPCPFDFTLAAIFRPGASESCRSYGSILFYVRHLPHLFADISIKPPFTVDGLSQVFNTIVERVEKLEGNGDFLKLKERLLEAKAEFSFSCEQTLCIEHTQPEESAHAPQLAPLPVPVGDFFAAQEHVLFVHTAQPLDVGERPCFLTGQPASSKLEEETKERIIAGHAALRSERRTVASVDCAKAPAAIFAITEQREALLGFARRRRAAMVTAMNAPYHLRRGKMVRGILTKATSHTLSDCVQQNLAVLPETIMAEVILKNNPDWLVQACPLLREEERAFLIQESKRYYYELVQIEVCSRALALLEKITPVSAGTELALPSSKPSTNFHYRMQKELHLLLLSAEYDFERFPEISYYFITGGGKLLYPEQYDDYIFICDAWDRGESPFLVRGAGGGKSTLFTPLLILRARMLNFLPVLYVSRDIYTIEKANLRRLFESMKKQLGVMEIGLHTNLTAKDCQFIFRRLEQYREEGRPLILTNEAFHALRLFYLHARFLEQDEEKEKWLHKIFIFLREGVIQLVDEPHRNLNPLTRSIFGAGDFMPLPEAESMLIVELMKPLLGYVPLSSADGTYVHDLAGLCGNLQYTPSIEDIAKIRFLLAMYMSRQIGLEGDRLLLEYWENPSIAFPQGEQYAGNAVSIAVVRHCLHRLLPLIVTKKTGLDHGPSLAPKEEFDVPASNGVVSTTSFQDPYLATALSMKGTAYRGLTWSQIHTILQEVMQNAWEEQKEGTTEMPNSYTRMFRAWMEGSKLAGMEAQDISPSDTEQTTVLHEMLSKHPGAIQFYMRIICSQIGYSPLRLTSSPAHLVHSARTTGYTATEGNEALYPHFDKRRQFAAFEAEVLHTYCQPQNSTILVSDSPRHFFVEMKSSRILQRVRVILDPSDYVECPNAERAKAWLSANLELEAVLYFQQNSTAAIDRQEHLCLLHRTRGEFCLEGDNLRVELAKIGFDYETLDVGVLYDSPHCEATNLDLKDNMIAAFLFTGHLTSSRMVQTLMRQRGFLDRARRQHVVTVLPGKLAEKIAPEGITTTIICEYGIKNEVETLEAQIILNAFQEIGYLVEECALRPLAVADVKERLAAAKGLAQGFLEEMPHDPVLNLGQPERFSGTEGILCNFAQTTLDRFHIHTPLRELPDLCKQIQAVVAQTEKRVVQISSRFHAQASGQIQQRAVTQTKQKQKTEVREHRPRRHDPFSALKVCGAIGPDHPEFLQAVQFKEVRALFDSGHFPPKFWFTENQLLTAEQHGSPLHERFLKPITHVMIIIDENGEAHAIAESNDLQNIFMKILRECKEAGSPLPHTAFLVRADGRMAQPGRGRLAPDPARVREIMTSAWFQCVIDDVHLLKGEVLDETRMVTRVRGQREFPALWIKIVAAQPSPEKAQDKLMQSIMKQAGL